LNAVEILPYLIPVNLNTIETHTPCILTDAKRFLNEHEIVNWKTVFEESVEKIWDD
jgi:hypothetical protein